VFENNFFGSCEELSHVQSRDWLKAVVHFLQLYFAKSSPLIILLSIVEMIFPHHFVLTALSAR